MRPYLLLAFILIINACSTPEGTRERAGKGGRYYGGVFNANETEELRGLFPLSLVQAASHRIAAQIYEGLVRLDQDDLSIVPALASSWTVDATGQIYTFTIREGVRFHDDPCFAEGKGRVLEAQDIVDCFTAICTFDDQNQMFWLFQDRLQGANAHYAATSKGDRSSRVSGLEVLDEQTVRISLIAPWPGFLQVLAHQGCWIWPRELREHYGAEVAWHPVGTGPFRVRSLKRGEALIMDRYPHHWEVDEHGNRLPFLDAIRYTFVQDKLRELEEFEKGNLSLIYELPIDRTHVLESYSDGRFQVQDIAGLTVQFYGFNSQGPPFDDPRVRKAFSMAIDRELLVDSVLNGLAVVASHGVVPPGFSGYPYDRIPKVRFDPDSARKLLVAAGYPGGNNLPTVFLQVNNNGFGYVRVAGVVQGMLEDNLGARVVTSVLPADQHFERVEQGKASFWREGWIADHPDPENFLALFHGRNVPADTSEPSYLNSTRYRNATYDSLFAKALRTSDEAERLGLLAAAERKLMEDAVVAPLYHERSIRLLQPWVMDMPINGMEYRDLRKAWFDPTLRPTD